MLRLLLGLSGLTLLAGDDVEVRWRMDRPARDAYVALFGTRTRDLTGDLTPVFTDVRANRRGTFRVLLRDATRVRFVHLIVTQPQSRRDRTRIVRVER